MRKAPAAPAEPRADATEPAASTARPKRVAKPVASKPSVAAHPPVAADPVAADPVGAGPVAAAQETRVIPLDAPVPADLPAAVSPVYRAPTYLPPAPRSKVPVLAGVGLVVVVLLLRRRLRR